MMRLCGCSKILTAIAMVAVLPAGLRAQAPMQARDSAELQLALDKLQVLGSVLYLAAHPDDENTAALAYFSKGRKLRAAYLSMTRGGGGQDLIGPELDDSLALIRTQELLAARRVDGAEQYFTRAVDFGYSKTPEETLSIWGHDAALADVVWIIRKFRPDVVVTRFTPTGGGTHGHHTASAMLALEAFKAAADPTFFPEQLRFVKPWQATRIAWNSYRPQSERDHMALGSFVTLDVGQYDALLGKSYAELAAESRSMHRSQGFGAVAYRGSRLEYLEILAGKPAKADLFEDVDLSWKRVPGGAAVGELLAQARREFKADRPSEILPLLFKAKALLDHLASDPWAELKRKELVEAIRCAAGIWVEAIADRQAVAAGSEVTVEVSTLVRGESPMTLAGVAIGNKPMHERNTPLVINQPVKESFTVAIAPEVADSQPYWLKTPRTGGLHSSAAADLMGLPEGLPALSATFRLIARGESFDLTVPVQYRFRDPVLGERYQPLVVMPSVMVNLSERVQVLGDQTPREIGLSLVAGVAPVSGKVRIQVPEGWRAEPSEISFSLAKPMEELKVGTRITAPANPQVGELKVLVEIGGRTELARGRVQINYPHIPLQTLFPPAMARLVKLDLRHNGRRIGYVMGAGDDIPQCLRPLGYEVDLLTDEALASIDLSAYDAIVVGIRAFNTRPRLAQLNARLLDYVAKGGTELVQYNVDQELVTESIGPYPFKLSRERVTDERAPMSFLAPEHPALNWPNKLTPKDFDGWVQERGLYFAQGWDPRYTTIFSTQDPGEKAAPGGLLIAPYGKGYFAYTGLAFFRQLPEGVPGAYRLFANLLALGKRHD